MLFIREHSNARGRASLKWMDAAPSGGAARRARMRGRSFTRSAAVSLVRSTAATLEIEASCVLALSPGKRGIAPPCGRAGRGRRHLCETWEPLPGIVRDQIRARVGGSVVVVVATLPREEGGRKSRANSANTIGREKTAPVTTWTCRFSPLPPPPPFPRAATRNTIRDVSVWYVRVKSVFPRVLLHLRHLGIREENCRRKGGHETWSKVWRIVDKVRAFIFRSTWRQFLDLSPTSISRSYCVYLYEDARE